MIPAEAIVHTVTERGIIGSIETVWVRHLSGKTSEIGFKTYEQGRRAFEGEAKDYVWWEEAPAHGHLQGDSVPAAHDQGACLDKAYAFVRHERGGDELSGTGERRIAAVEIRGAGRLERRSHLDEEEKRKLVANTPPYQVKARTVGEPALGAGAVYLL
jgi:hypothetical protein